jgi:hypothetical protein
VIAQPSDFVWHLAVVDPGSCRVIVQGVILEPTPYVVATELAYTFNGLGQIRSTVIKQGDPDFDAAQTAKLASAEDWSDIAADRRNTRAELIAAATAYLDRLGGDAADVSLAASCQRIDNGAHSANCEAAAGPAFVERRLTVDEAKGAVAVSSNRGEAEGPPDMRIFRIEDGRVRYVHAIAP